MIIRRLARLMLLYVLLNSLGAHVIKPKLKFITILLKIKIYV